MEELLAKLPQYAQLASVILSGIVVVASVVVKLLPGPSADAEVSKAGKILFKVMTWLPFFGNDPRVKSMQAAFEQIQGASPAALAEKPADGPPKVS